jgi:arginyl-tRNA synthetase
MLLEARTTIERILRETTGLSTIQLTDGGEHADLASTAAFALAKEKKQSPVQIAQGLATELSSHPGLKAMDVTIETKGPYLNFRFGKGYTRETLMAAVKPGYGSLPKKEQPRICLEHTSANPDGPIHVGHIRNSVIGDTLGRAFRKAGYTLEIENYVNDMGRQVAILVWGFDHLDSAPKEGEKEDSHIARLYIAANREMEKDPAIKGQIDQLMQMVEKGEIETVKKFRKQVQRCLDGFAVTLRDLNVAHDRFVWESDFIRNGYTERIINRIRKLPQVREDGTLALDLSEFGFENKYVIRRSDGTSVYAARDLAFHAWKGANFDRVIDILGADHKLIGSQLQCTLKLLGEKAPEIVFFEFVSLPEGSMSTRAGKFISADELISEVRKQAFTEVTTRRPELSESERREIAISVALAAIRYDIVKISPEKSTVFDWKEALNFERQSGPYIQYAHARACSILEKAGGFTECYDLETEQEIILAKQIARFPDVISNVVAELRPNLLATYSRELADSFNSFYHFEQVLKSEGDVRNRRLTLVKAVRNTLKEALETLGIDAISTM